MGKGRERQTGLEGEEGTGKGEGGERGRRPCLPRRFLLASGLLVSDCFSPVTASKQLSVVVKYISFRL